MFIFQIIFAMFSYDKYILRNRIHPVIDLNKYNFVLSNPGSGCLHQLPTCFCDCDMVGLTQVYPSVHNTIRSLVGIVPSQGTDVNFAQS